MDCSVSAPNLWGTSYYNYDALDNLTANTITAGATARGVVFNYPDPSTNRLMSASGTSGYNFTYAYDSQGNIVQRGAQQYIFDQGNRLTSAVGQATYGYDGLGHRFTVVGTDGVNRVQVYSQEGQLLYVAPTNGAGTKYVYMHNHVIAEVTSSVPTYDHTDGLGSPVAQSDASKSVGSPTRYEPYGYIATGTPRKIGFTGHVNDTETGLIYMQQRYYDPVAGRFLSIDPVTTDTNTGDSFNRYAYAKNSPYRYIDPDGRLDASTCSTLGAMNCINEGGSGGAASSTGKVKAQSTSVGSDSNSSYDPNDVRGGFDERGRSLVYNPANYDPAAAAQMLFIVATIITPGGGIVPEVAEVAAKIVSAERIGSALVKSDINHIAPSFLSKSELAAGKVFPVVGGDGIKRMLLQTSGRLNEKKGIYEYILTASGQVSHQRFIAGGSLTGVANQTVGK